MILNNTRAVLHSVIQRLKYLAKVSDIVSQVLLILMCGFNIYKNIENTVRLIVYACMAIVCVAWLVYSLVYYAHEFDNKEGKKQKKKIGNIVKWIKMLYKVAIISFNAVEIALYGYTFMTMCVLILTVFTFLLQIVFTIIANQVTFYISMFEFAIEKDMEIFDKTKGVFEKIVHPIYGVSSMFVHEEKPLEKGEEKKAIVLEKMKEELSLSTTDKKAKKKEEKKSLKAENKVRRKETVKQFKTSIKGKFHKKKKEEQQTENALLLENGKDNGREN